MGQIKLTQLRFHTCHGALPHEQHVAQEFWVDVEVHMDVSAAGESDRLRDTVNYAAIAHAVEAIMMGPPVKLLETLATRIHSAVHGQDPRIDRVGVKVTKVDPPLGIPSGGVAVVVDDHG